MDTNGFNSNGAASANNTPAAAAPKIRRASQRTASGGNPQSQAATVLLPSTDPSDSTGSDVLLSKPSPSQDKTLSWWSPRLPTEGELSQEWKKHEEQVPELLRNYPARAWDAVQKWIMARVAAASSHATERAAQEEVKERKRVNAERRSELIKDLAKNRADTTASTGAIGAGRKELATKAGDADLILSDIEKMKLPGAAQAIKAALDSNIPSDEALAGRWHWMPGSRRTSGNVSTGSQRVVAVGRSIVDILVALAFGMLAGLTLGILTGLIRPADLRAPDANWPKLLMAWIIGTFIEAKAAHTARDAADISSYSWNARQEHDRATSVGVAADKLPAIDGQRGDTLSIATAFWLFCGLSLLHGMGIHHIATHAASRLKFGQGAAPGAGMEFPLWLFFVAGGVATAAYMGSHAVGALKEARAAQRDGALESLRWQHRKQLLDDKDVHAALVAANSLDALAQHALDLAADYEVLVKRLDQTFETPLSETSRSALRAADDEARGERLRAQENMAKLIGVLEPMPDARTARKNFERQKMGRAS